MIVINHKLMRMSIRRALICHPGQMRMLSRQVRVAMHKIQRVPSQPQSTCQNNGNGCHRRER